MSGESNATLPDFELAELQGFDPAALDMDTPAGRFILVLAAVFNDLKGAWYLVERLRAAQPIANRNLASRAQLSGMTIQTSRTIASILHELMEAIREHKAVIESSDFRELVARLPDTWRGAWSRVRRIALDEKIKDTDTDARLLFFIRNKMGFHYDDKALARGYREFFADTTRPLHERAVVSDGTSMETTRFYFADAAMEQALYAWTGLSAHDLHRRISDISSAVNSALKFIVIAYIKKVATLSRYRPTGAM